MSGLSSVSHELHQYDQRSMHQTEVHNHDQRSVYVDQRQVNVGLDPFQVQAREDNLMAQANAAVTAARQQVHVVESQAQQFVMNARSEAQSAVEDSQRQAQQAVVAARSVEERAHGLVEQMNERHQQELSHVQSIAQEAFVASQQRLLEADQKIQQLLGVIDNQSQQLERQRVEQEGLATQIATLQSQITMLKHSAPVMPMPVTQERNGTVDVLELKGVIDTLRSEIRHLQQPKVIPVPIATPPQHCSEYGSPLSACAGYPDPLPVSFGVPNLSQPPRKPPSSRSHRSSPMHDLFSASTPSRIPPPHHSPSGSSSSSSDGKAFPRDYGGSGSPHGSSPPGGNTPAGSAVLGPGGHSVGVGSAVVQWLEKDVYRSKDLSLIRIEHLPTSASEFRSWRNTFLTRVASIDQTGNDVILNWLMVAFEEGRDIAEFTASGLLPRLDSHIGSLIMDSRHLKGELGMKFQTYAESCQMSRHAPRGRAFLHMIAQHFRLDLNRGSNLTQQALLDLQLDGFTAKDLEKFVERIEYVLNGIPQSHQPSEVTKFTWLHSRVKRCKLLQRHIDRIRDSRETSHVRTWDWLMNKIKSVLIEVREDQNEESIRNSLASVSPKPKAKGHPKGEGKGKANLAVDGGDVANAADSKASTAMPVPTAKPKAKGHQKGIGKGEKGKGSPKEQPKASQPTSKAQSPPKAKSKTEPGKPSVKCLFYPNCNRGANCPFVHEGPPAAKPGPKGPAPKAATAKAAIATVIATSATHGAEAVRSNMSLIGKTFQLAMYPFKALFAVVATLSSLITPEPQAVAKPDGGLQLNAAPSSGSPLLGGPVVVHKAEAAYIASASERTSVELEWIADSGASRSLASVRSLTSQGLPESSVYKCILPASTISFETGNGTTKSMEQFPLHGSKFGTYEHRILDDCPIARSLGEMVSKGLPFIWMPGELPYFAQNADSVKINCKGQRLWADRVEENVPIFKETVQLAANPARALQHVVAPSPHALAAGEESAADVAAESADADSEDGDEEPLDKMQKLVRESQTLEHMMWHIPKNPACPICNRSRMYRKRVSRFRHDPLKDRGGLSPVESFGERIATDFIIVQKLASGRENSVQIIRDEHSGWIRAYPITKRDTSAVVRNLLNFLGPSYNQPCIMIKSDQARETRLAAQQLGFVFEGTLENRFPHNSVLERDVRTLEEVTRACHLQAGFDVIPGLWQHSVDYAATIINAKHVASGREETRHKLAVGEEFTGRQLLLGQLVHYRVDPSSRGKFDASTRPGLFVGWRYDEGPKSHKGVYYVLDYQKVKNQEAGYSNSIAVPFEEIFVEEGPAKLPVRVAAEDALASFKDPSLEDVAPLDIPFSSLTSENVFRKNEYITLDRIIRFGPTVGCKACAFTSEHSVHSPVCRARFNALIRANRVATGTKTPATLPPTPAVGLDADIVPECPPASDVEGEERQDPDDLPFSAGILPGHPEAAAVGKVALVIDDAFVETNRARSKARRFSTLKGQGVLFEYACSENSVIGDRSQAIGVKCIRLTRGVLDLCNPEHVKQAVQQLESLPGADSWFSITCTPIQRLNLPQYGKHVAKKLTARKEQTRQMLGLAMQFAEACMTNQGRIAFDLPQEAGIWELPEWLEFEERWNLKRAYCNGCTVGLTGNAGMLSRKPWCICTNDLRMLQFVNQSRCDEIHQHEESPGGIASRTVCCTSSFADTILEAWYPQIWYKHVPQLAVVTKSLSKKEWLADPRGIEAVQKEAVGLRANNTWDDQTVSTLHQVRHWAKSVGIPIKVAELLTLCGIKHWELEPEHWRWKGRIVYRGDRVFDEHHNWLLFDETSTTPTSLVALNVALWYACLPGHSASCSDAIQAFLQSALDDSDYTYVVIPPELWLDSWHSKFATHEKIVVRLKKSLYGHPKAGRWWQEHLDRVLREIGAKEMPMYPSNYIINWNCDGQTHVLLLNVYVDDLTLCGNQSCHSSFWAKLRQSVKLEDETHIGRQGTLVLGRKHFISVEEGRTHCEFDMRPYAETVVDTYCELTGYDKKKFRAVATPHIVESGLSDEDLSSEGVLSKNASRILMRLLWLSRLARPDLSFITTRLASRVSAWTKFEDRQLHRCMAYLHHSSDLILTGSVQQGCTPRLDVYTDSDFASCLHTAKSTSGLWIAITTGDCSFPIFWQSKRQGSVARSTTEAELIAMAGGLFGEVYNLQAFLEYLTQTGVEVKFWQDNNAVLQVLRAGYSAKLRHCGRVHKVNVASITEALKEENFSAEHCSTMLQRANGFTKVIPPQEWTVTLQQFGLAKKT